MFLTIAVGAYESYRAGSFAGGAISGWLAYVAQALYLGPSRRALTNPVRDFPAWERELMPWLESGGAPAAVSRGNGELLASEAL